MDDYIGEIVKYSDKTQYKPLNEIVFEGIRSAIIYGKLPYGVRINEKEYADRMNISRTPIREALQRLEKESLVEYIPHYGTIVKKITIDDAKEIYQIRKSLEILASINAMNIMTESCFKELENKLIFTEELNKSEDNLNKVIDHFSDFNEAIYDFSKMPRLKSIVTRLKEYLACFRDISLKDPIRRNEALEEHWMIFHCMVDKNEKDLEKIIREHLTRSEKFIIEEMEKELYEDK